ncbi:hypothetical protein CSUI_010161, partial [Cystoisospora suis]
MAVVTLTASTRSRQSSCFTSSSFVLQGPRLSYRDEENNRRRCESKTIPPTKKAPQEYTLPLLGVFLSSWMKKSPLSCPSSCFSLLFSRSFNSLSLSQLKPKKRSLFSPSPCIHHVVVVSLGLLAYSLAHDQHSSTSFTATAVQLGATSSSFIRSGEYDRRYFSYADGRERHEEDPSFHLKSLHNGFAPDSPRQQGKHFSAELHLHQWNPRNAYPESSGVYTPYGGGEDTEEDGILRLHHASLLRNRPERFTEEGDHLDKNHLYTRLMQKRRSSLSSLSLAQLRDALQAPSDEEEGESSPPPASEEEGQNGEGNTQESKDEGVNETGEKGGGEEGEESEEGKGGEGEQVETSPTTPTGASAEESPTPTPTPSPSEEEGKASTENEEPISTSAEEPAGKEGREGVPPSTEEEKENISAEAAPPSPTFSMTTTTTGTPSAFNVEEALHAPAPTGEAGQPFQSQAEKLLKKEEEIVKSEEEVPKEEQTTEKEEEAGAGQQEEERKRKKN